MLPTQRPFEGLTYFDSLRYLAPTLGTQGGWSQHNTGNPRTGGGVLFNPADNFEADAQHDIPIVWTQPFHLRLQLRIPATGPDAGAFLFIGFGDTFAGLEFDWDAGNFATETVGTTILYDAAGAGHSEETDDVPLTVGTWHDLTVYYDGTNTRWELDGRIVTTLAASSYVGMTQKVQISLQANNPADRVQLRNLIITNP